MDARVVPSSGTKQYNFQAPVLVGACAAGFADGIEDAVNKGKALEMGTVLCDNWTSLTYSPTTGVNSLPALSQVNGINNLGQIVGDVQNSDSVDSVLYSPGANPTITPIHGPDGEFAELYSINDAGWIVGDYQDQNSIYHCMLTKPPYTSPFSFDSIGNISCGSGSSQDPLQIVTWLIGGNEQYGWLGINGLGEIVGSSVSYSPGPYENGTQLGTELFLDDVENGIPGPSDNLSILATTQGMVTLVPAGINNNGQVAGTYAANYGCNSEPDQGFFVNTDGSFSIFSIPSTDSDGCLAGINDDVQMVGWDGILGGFTIDTQH